MVQCLSDRGNYFLLTGLPIAVAGYFSVCLSTSSRWLKLLIAVVSAQVLYALLALNAPTIFYVDFGPLMLLMLAVFFAAVRIAAAYAAEVTVLIFVMSIASVVVYQFATDFTALVRDRVDQVPEWMAFAVFVVVILFLLFLLYKSRIMPLIGYFIRILYGSLSMFIFVRLAGLEYDHYPEPPVLEVWETPAPDFRPPPDVQPAPFLDGRFSRLGICCGDGEPKGRCPLSFDDWFYNTVLFGLVVVLTVSVYYCRRRARESGATGCCCSRAAKAKKTSVKLKSSSKKGKEIAKDGKGEFEAAMYDSEEEEE